ncbi:hypothetical protein EIG98_11140, partial [Staphylococcus condimenti]
SEIAQMLQNFSIALYPLEIENVASIKDWVNSFYVYIEKMLNLKFVETENINEEVNNWIEKVQENIK